jgi:hypothetical protein
MTDVFSITTPTATIKLAPNRTGQASYTVTNVSPRALRAQARIVEAATAPTSWFSLNGQADQNYDPGTVRQFVIDIVPPLGAPAGSYEFRLDVVGIDHPDDDSAQGPSCEVTIPPSDTPTPITAPRGYIATAVGALIGGIVGEAVVVGLALSSNNTSPTCSGVSCIVSGTIGAVIALVFALLAGLALLWIGGAIGASVALRVRHFAGAKLTGTFFAILMLPWLLLMGFGVFRFIHSLILLAVSAPVLLVVVPAILARGGVLLIRTHRI